MEFKEPIHSVFMARMVSDIGVYWPPYILENPA